MDTAEFYSAGSPAAQKRYRYVFGSGDALNRLKSADFSSWSGSAWTATLAYDLAGITYDADGNLTALQRYRETATLIDNLTYAYPGTSNRLTSVTDAVAATAETWDAETGAFTYDANGNLKTAPAPYSITAVTYDPANLPLSITRSGTTTAYRYDGAEQRITKQVGSGNTEVYVLEGASTLGVFTVNSGGSATSWYFNLLAEGHVEGRQPNTGSRRYYYTDHLGSTRAVVQGTTVVESYDFEPWGLLMPGRTLGSGTKEGFSAKESDAETGLDYFGARYYMPALGRWGAVDPSADRDPQWSPYAYVYDNPGLRTDPDGRQVFEFLQMFIARHPKYVQGVGEGVAEGAQNTWSAITHPLRTLNALSTVAAAARGDPFAATAVGQGLQASARATLAELKSGPEGWGRLTGRGGWAFLEMGVTWGAGEVIGAARVARAGELGIAPDAARGTTATANEAFHYTFGRAVASIKREGLRAGSYATPTGTSSSLQAQIDLALSPTGLRGALLRVDLAGLRQAGFEIPEITQVGRNYGMPGGGFQLQFPYRIPPEFITVVRQ